MQLGKRHGRHPRQLPPRRHGRCQPILVASARSARPAHAVAGAATSLRLTLPRYVSRPECSLFLVRGPASAQCCTPDTPVVFRSASRPAALDLREDDARSSPLLILEVRERIDGRESRVVSAAHGHCSDTVSRHPRPHAGTPRQSCRFDLSRNGEGPSRGHELISWFCWKARSIEQLPIAERFRQLYSNTRWGPRLAGLGTLRRSRRQNDNHRIV